MNTDNTLELEISETIDAIPVFEDLNDFRIACELKVLEVLHEFGVDTEAHHPDYDPTPWCHQCHAETQAQCDCGPYADNH